jgi:hypothetical protein
MINRKFYVGGVLILTLLLLPAHSVTISAITLSHDGSVFAWIRNWTVYVSTSAQPDKSDSVNLPYFSPESANELSLSGDGKSLFVVSNIDSVYRARINNGTLDSLKCITSCKLRPFWTDVSYDGCTVSGLLAGTGEGNCWPIWDAITFLKLENNNWVQNGPLTPAEECSFVRDAFYDESGTITFAISDSVKIFQIHKPYIKNNYFNIGLDGYKLAYFPVSSDGHSLLLYKKRFMQSTGDSTYSLYFSSLNDGTWTEPFALLPDHRDPVLWHSCLSPDGKHICWVHLYRGKDGNQIIKTQVFIMHRNGDKWTAPEPLFCLPDRQVWECVMSDSNILISNTESSDLFFYSTLDNSGKLLTINESSYRVISVGELTGLIDLSVKTIYTKDTSPASQLSDDGTYLLTGRKLQGSEKKTASKIVVKPAIGNSLLMVKKLCK